MSDDTIGAEPRQASDHTHDNSAQQESVDNYAREQIERNLIGLMLLNAAAIDIVFRELRGLEFVEFRHTVLCEIIRQERQSAGMASAEVVAARAASAVHISEETVLDYLRACKLDAPQFGSQRDLEKQIVTGTNALREGRKADLRRQADQMLRQGGIDVFNDVTELLAADTASPRFQLIPFSEIAPATDPEYLITGLIPRTGLTVIWGAPKCGKSFWVFDALMHVARGLPEYRGRRVSRGPVVYGAFEGGEGFKKRIAAYRMEHCRDDTNVIPFSLLPVRVDLIRDHGQLIDDIRAQLPSVPPVVIVLDTVNRSLTGSESKDEDMSAYIAAADAVREAFNCAVVLVHHCGVDGTRPRGHTSLTGAADAQLAVRREAENIIVKVEWMKDGPEGDEIASHLMPVNIEGTTLMSCVVQPVEMVPRASRPKQSLTARQSNAVDTLQALIAVEGSELPSTFNLPAGVSAVPVERWREELLSRGIVDGEGTNPRADFRRLKDALQARKLICERDGRIWMV
jgi:hypothetical protein